MTDLDRNALEWLLEDAWDAGNAAGLDGWTGPGRGGQTDREAVYQRERDVTKLLGDIASGDRPTLRLIGDATEFDTLRTFPCIVREQPDEPNEFYPQLWEMGFQTGWCRVGKPFDPEDCTPELPVVVLLSGSVDA